MSTKNQRLASIGENMVVVRLLQAGIDAYNANNLHTNYARVDIICPTDTGFIQVQVKTSDEKEPNFPTGLTIEEAKERTNIEKAVIGPWVFVYTKGKGHEMTFEYYILTREETIKLIYESNRWYLNDFKRSKEIKTTSPVGVKLSWIKGIGEKRTSRHEPFVSPILPGSAKNAWHKISGNE